MHSSAIARMHQVGSWDSGPCSRLTQLSATAAPPPAAAARVRVPVASGALPSRAPCQASLRFALFHAGRPDRGRGGAESLRVRGWGSGKQQRSFRPVPGTSIMRRHSRSRGGGSRFGCRRRGRRDGRYRSRCDRGWCGARRDWSHLQRLPLHFAGERLRGDHKQRREARI